MDKELKKIFQNEVAHPELKLSDDIWHAVLVEQKRHRVFAFWIFTFVGVLSIGAIIPLYQTIISRFAQSGFSEYFSLILSDAGSITSFWKEILLSLASSIPLLPVIIFFGIITVLLYTFKQLAKNIRGTSFYKFN